MGVLFRGPRRRVDFVPGHIRRCGRFVCKLRGVMGLIRACTEIRRRLVAAVEMKLRLVLVGEGDRGRSGPPRLLSGETEVIVRLRVCYRNGRDSGLFWVPRCIGAMGLEAQLVELLPRFGGTGVGTIPHGCRVGHSLVRVPGGTVLEEKLLCRPVRGEASFI